MTDSLDYEAYRQADAADRRLAAQISARITDPLGDSFEARADRVYAWLRARATVQPARLIVVPGPVQDQPPGGQRMALELDMTDVQQDDFTVQPVDSKGFATADGPLTWSEDSNGAVIAITPSADGMSVTAVAVAPGQATLSVTDGTLTGSELVVVTPGPVASLQITAGTPTDQAPPGP
jgi:hypothetical protein